MEPEAAVEEVIRVVAKWDKQSEFLGPTPYQGPGRVFGTFYCVSCKKTWSSAGSWANKGQECHSCRATVLPYIQKVIRSSANSKLKGFTWDLDKLYDCFGPAGVAIFEGHLEKCDRCQVRRDENRRLPCGTMVNLLLKAFGGTKAKDHDVAACEKCKESGGDLDLNKRCVLEKAAQSLGVAPQRPRRRRPRVAAEHPPASTAIPADEPRRPPRRRPPPKTKSTTEPKSIVANEPDDQDEPNTTAPTSPRPRRRAGRGKKPAQPIEAL